MIEFFLMAFFMASGPERPASDGGTAAPAGSPANFKRPVEITADKLAIAGKRSEAIWSGHVKARRGTTLLRCDRLIAHYTRAQEITRIECVGGVEVEDGDRWAKGERADFDNVTGVLEVTGSPEARQGPNHMRGTKVTFLVEKDVIEVQNAQTVFETSARGGPVPGTRSKGGKKAGP